MDLTFVFTAVVVTLLAMVVATTLFSRSSTVVDDTTSISVAQSGQVERTLQRTGLLGNGAEKSKSYTKTQKPECKSAERRAVQVADIRVEATPTKLEFSARKTRIEGSSRAIPPTLKEMAPRKNCSSSCFATDKLQRSISKEITFDPDSSLEDLSGRGHGFMGLSEKELLKCAFSDHHTDGTILRNGEDDIRESDLNSTSLKYIPGMLRAKQMEKLMTREELEEEQRVQREQLTAIFQLLRENQDTFGEVSEGEVEEQLKLYSI